LLVVARIVDRLRREHGQLGRDPHRFVGEPLRRSPDEKPRNGRGCRDRKYESALTCAKDVEQA